MTPIATDNQFAQWARRNGVETYPEDIEDLLVDATRQVQEACGREFVPSPETAGQTETRKFVGDGTTLLFVDDLLTVASVSVSGGAVTDYECEPRGKTPTTHMTRAVGWPGGSEIAVVGRFGYSEVADLPGAVTRACCALAGLIANEGADFQRDLEGIKSESVLNVKVEYNAGSGLEAVRQRIMDSLKPYARMF